MPIESDPATINAAAKDVATATQTAQTHLGKLGREVADLQPHWQGLAGATFQNVMESYHEQSTRLVDALSGISDLLHQQGVSIEALEEEGQAAMNKYAGPLAG